MTGWVVWECHLPSESWHKRGALGSKHSVVACLGLYPPNFLIMAQLILTAGETNGAEQPGTEGLGRPASRFDRQVGDKSQNRGGDCGWEPD